VMWMWEGETNLGETGTYVEIHHVVPRNVAKYHQCCDKHHHSAPQT
jgi:hypothetical protein